MKRIVLMLLAVLLLITGCSDRMELSPEQRETRNQLRYLEAELNQLDASGYDKNASEDLLFWERSSAEYAKDPGVHDYGDLNTAPLDNTAEIDELGEELVRFIDETYHQKWIYEPLDVVVLNEELSDYAASELTDFVAAYVPQKKHLMISQSVYEERGTNRYNYAIAHEIIHYLTELNLGTPYFNLRKNGLVSGEFLHEAVTEAITYAFMEKVMGVPPLQIHNGAAECSGYEMLLYNIDAINLVFDIDLVEELLNGNIESVGQRINDVLGDDTTFVRMLNTMDIVERTVIKGDLYFSYEYQFLLSQLYFFVADSKEEKALIALTEEYITRFIFIKPRLRTSDNCIAFWGILAENLTN